MQFNVIKVDAHTRVVSLLHYPGLEVEPFPALTESWTASDSTMRYRDYRSSRNPPILHRKELVLPSGSPLIAPAAQLTKTLEEIGAFQDTARIGYLLQWRTILRQLGFTFDDTGLVPIGNASSDEMQFELEDVSGDVIHRHRTALSRSVLSAPVQLLQRHGFISSEKTFFDYGCGRGDDLTAVGEAGVAVAGWDPHFRSDAALIQSDVVNLGFVLNVIEDVEERRVALRGAFALANTVLSIAVMPVNNRSERGVPHGDGVLTSRRTFQHYFEQSELALFIEEALDVVPVLVAPGIAFVFREPERRQDFLHSRISRSRSTNRERVPRRPTKTTTSTVRERRSNAHTGQFELCEERLRILWTAALVKGRLPTRSEAGLLNVGAGTDLSYAKALQLIATHFDSAELSQAQIRVSENLLLLIVEARLVGRGRRASVSGLLSREINHFFGSVDRAVEEADRLLLLAGDQTSRNQAATDASAKGIGYLADQDSLQFEVQYLTRLPMLLRVTIQAALVLHGDIEGFDLIKIHLRSNKVTLLKFDSFIQSALPKMVERVKIDLRYQRVDHFVYGGEYPEPYLYMKSRFMHEESPHYPEQCAFDEKMERLLGGPLDGFGPSVDELTELLQDQRLEVKGFDLAPTQSIPSLDTMCGRYFTFRRLIECGEMQSSLKLPNRPEQADTYNALHRLAVSALDPLIDEFGQTSLTFGFCSGALARQIRRRIQPDIDQHAGHELNRLGRRICARGGAAVDFLMDDQDMREVANWIVDNLPFDRLYFYGSDRPIHISVGPEESRSAWEMVESVQGHRRPTRYKR